MVIGCWTKNRGGLLKPSKMDGESNGQNPDFLMDDLGGTIIFGNIHIVTQT